MHSQQIETHTSTLDSTQRFSDVAICINDGFARKMVLHRCTAVAAGLEYFTYFI